MPTRRPSAPREGEFDLLAAKAQPAPRETANEGIPGSVPNSSGTPSKKLSSEKCAAREKSAPARGAGRPVRHVRLSMRQSPPLYSDFAAAPSDVPAGTSRATSSAPASTCITT